MRGHNLLVSSLALSPCLANDWRGCRGEDPALSDKDRISSQSVQLHQTTSHWSLTNVPQCLNKSKAATMAGFMHSPESLRTSAMGYADIGSLLNWKYKDLPLPPKIYSSIYTCPFIISGPSQHIHQRTYLPKWMAQ